MQTSTAADETVGRVAIDVSLLGGSAIDLELARAERLWADGVRHGNPPLIGLTWTYGKPSQPGQGEIWQLVHHYTHLHRTERDVRRRFGGVRREQHVEATYSWTAYVYSAASDRLCRVEHLRGRELLDTWWRQDKNRAYGERMLDLRWEPAATGAQMPTPAQAVTVNVDRRKPLFSQLVSHQQTHGIGSWGGLTWRHTDGRRRRVADDPIVQRAYHGGSPAYRVVIVDTFEGSRVVDRQVREIPSMQTWIDALNDELSDDAPDGDFAWTSDAH